MNIMRRSSLAFILTLLAYAGFGQQKSNKQLDLGGRANDHFMLQFSTDSWLEAPDSIDSRIKGFNRGLNIYFMLDKPFRSNKKWSIGAGVGIASSHIFLEKMQIGLGGTGRELAFTNTDSSASFKKYKLATSYLEIPLEFRFSSKPDDPNKSIKVAVGLKGGLLINAHTKGKELESADGERLLNGVQKQSSKQYFNSSRLALTARFNYGVWGIFGAYNLTPMFKSGVASQDIRLLQVGVVLSGL
jgi:hypothetical protein